MRTAETAASLLVLAAAGALIGLRLTAPADGGGAATAPPAAVIRSAQPTTVPPPSGVSEGPGTAGPTTRQPDESSALTSLVVRSADGRTILATTVGAFDPISTADGYRAIDPPQWNQAVWVRYRPPVPPTETERGTAYVYGHACRHHVCSFTDLARAQPGGSITVSRGARSLSYRIESVSADYPKSGPGSLAELRSGVADRSIAHRLVLITCGYERYDVSRNNVVVVAVRQ